MEQPATVCPRWVSYSKAERLYGLSRTTLWRLAKTGDIRAARIGRAVRLDCRSLEGYLRKRAADFE
jgi:excisionase family DNA binding protein